jgi:5-methylcytosine-specific restriction protein A
MRNPDWVRDEIILAMDLYVRAGRKQLPPGDEEVVRLSQLLNDLPIHPASLRDDNFRNPAGISMVMGNFLGIDPLHDQSGLSRNNQLQASVWDDFIENPGLLRRTAEAIQAVCDGDFEECGDLIDEEEVFPEGQLLTKQHVYRERNRAVVAAKIDQVWHRDGRLPCEACGFDFFAFYGDVGRRFAECHHVVPLAELAFVGKTQLVDLAIVCANCHRMLHRGRPVLKIEALQSIIARQKQLQIGGTA